MIQWQRYLSRIEIRYNRRRFGLCKVYLTKSRYESAFEQMELYIAMISFVPKCHYRRIIEIIASLFVPNLEINPDFTLGTSNVPIIDQDPCNNAITYTKEFLIPVI